ncbi:hypothetical protein F4823DRAFT_365177 [Ustulina deusta]|nr:hypothetical protein F4823DRAFT_365177 [Ustulina deusta]
MRRKTRCFRSPLPLSFFFSSLFSPLSISLTLSLSLFSSILFSVSFIPFPAGCSTSQGSLHCGPPRPSHLSACNSTITETPGRRALQCTTYLPTHFWVCQHTIIALKRVHVAPPRHGCPEPITAAPVATTLRLKTLPTHHRMLRGVVWCVSVCVCVSVRECARVCSPFKSILICPFRST